MLIAGGLDLNDRPISAQDYSAYLPKKGFSKVAELGDRSEQKDWTDSTAQVGDIAVMRHGQHGHICFYNGKQWISDFVQDRMWVYAGNGTCEIFRFDIENA